MRDILTRIRGMIGIGQVGKVDDAQPQQVIQLKIGQGGPDELQEIIDNLVRLSEYGFASRPPTNAQAVAIFMGGNRSTGFIVATGDQATRLKNLLAGESAIYNGVRGQFVKAADDGKIHINADVVIDGALLVGKDITDQTAGDNTKTLKNLRDDYNAHDHTDPQGGTSGPASPQCS